ncbi:histidine kinase [Corynebacterium sp. H128]|uniref:sensor histidine kinase n=1 Tax=unclassified Corynebacterium TaxID=2624378 RepID=UPI0030B6F121
MEIQRPKRRFSRYLAAVPGSATVLFGIACVVDSAMGNQIEIPVPWLMIDVLIGFMALVLSSRQLSPRAVLLASLISSSATGSALAQIARISWSGQIWKAQLSGLLFCIFSVLRWQLPWSPEAFYHRHWSGLILVSVTAQCFIAWGGFFGSQARLVQSLREQNTALILSKEADVNFALAQERLALSREMHDVLAHRISLISMHSAALECRESMDSEERQSLGGIIRFNAKASLSELRAILSDLREEQLQERQPDVEDLPSLAMDGADLQHPVKVTVNLGGATLPPGTGRHLYRIAQEAVTNARKYGVPGDIQVDLQCSQSECILEITNPTGTEPETPPGLGIKGMLERVHLCGGQLTRSLHNNTHQLRINVPVEESQ